jgi:uracil-DNA glycosylase family 4
MNLKKIVNKINERLVNCNKCKNCETKGGSWTSCSEDSLDIIFVAQNPGKSNYNKGFKPDQIIPFGIDKNGNYSKFFTILKEKFKEKYNRELKFYITNIFKCVTKDNSAPEEMIKKCLPLLESELKYIHAKLIIALGKTARDNIPKDIQFVNVPHPGYLNRQGLEAINEAVDKVLDNYFQSILF